MINDLLKESLKQLLLAQKFQLLDKMKQERSSAKIRVKLTAQLSSAEESHAYNFTKRDTAFSIQEHDMAELDATKSALIRITQGTYGFCLACECEISINRLLTFHSAMRCIECQATFEKAAGPHAALHLRSRLSF